MFKIIDHPEFTHDVTVMVPVDGGHEEQTFKARFRTLPEEEQESFDLATLKGMSGFLKKAIVSFEDVVGSDNKPVPYSAALRDQIIGFPYVGVALLRTYMTAITKARVGN